MPLNGLLIINVCVCVCVCMCNEKRFYINARNTGFAYVYVITRVYTERCAI